MIQRTTPLLNSGDIFKINSNPLEEILKCVDKVRCPETYSLNKKNFKESSFSNFSKNHYIVPDESKNYKIKILKEVSRLEKRKKFSASIFQKVLLITKRDYLLTKREPFGYLFYLAQVFFIGGFGCIVYKHTSRDYITPSGPNVKDIFDRAGSFLFILMNTYFTLVLNSSFRMASENLVLYKEISDRYYSALLYLITKIILDVFYIQIPMLVIAYPVNTIFFLNF